MPSSARDVQTVDAVCPGFNARQRTLRWTKLSAVAYPAVSLVAIVPLWRQTLINWLTRKTHGCVSVRSAYTDMHACTRASSTNYTANIPAPSTPGHILPTRGAVWIDYASKNEIELRLRGDCRNSFFFSFCSTSTTFVLVAKPAP